MLLSIDMQCLECAQFDSKMLDQSGSPSERFKNAWIRSAQLDCVRYLVHIFLHIHCKIAIIQLLARLGSVVAIIAALLPQSVSLFS